MASTDVQPVGTGAPASLVNRDMTMRQWRAVAVCVFLNVIDGIDILVMATAASSVKVDLGLSGGALGVVLSASLAGMTFGALIISPLADRLGRRPIILGCLAIEALGTFLAGFAPGLVALVACRALTGLGVGGIMPVINTAVAEVASARQRNLAITAQAIGYPLGGLLAAIAGSLMLETHGWRPLLQLASVPALLGIGLVLLYLPESVEFLIARRPDRALVRVNHALAMLGKVALTRLPVSGEGTARAGPRALFRRPMIGPFALFSGATFLTQFSFYFFISWLPSLLAPHFAASSIPNAGSVTLNLGGIVGDIIFGLLCLRIGTRNLTSASLCTAFVSIVAVGGLLRYPVATLALPLVAGGALFAAMAGIYATAPRIFGPLVRAAGTGIAFSLGRFGGALAPMAGGVLLAEADMDVGTVLVVMAAPLLLAVILLAPVARRT